jgi:hypothetical protein
MLKKHHYNIYICFSVVLDRTNLAGFVFENGMGINILRNYGNIIRYQYKK